MNQSVSGNLLRILPKNLLSYWVGRMVHLPLPRPLALWSMRWFAKRYRLNLREAEKPLEAYKSIGDLFTRRLQPGVRPIGEGVIHPVDAVLSSAGVIKDGRLFQAKGKHYSIVDLFGETSGIAQFEGGSFWTYYLCPTDYHRVHAPVSGRILKAAHLPGRLWPVNPWSVAHISQLFSVNERVSVWIDTDQGPVVVVMVGATNVGKITTSFDPRIVTNNQHRRRRKVRGYDPAIPIEKGQELGVFNMGSTVIVLFPPGYVNPPKAISCHVKLGESINQR